MKVQLGGKFNIYTAVLNVSAKTLTISNVLAFDLNIQSLVSIWDSTLGTPAFITILTGTTVAKVLVGGLPTWVYTFPTLPAGVANTDTLVILLDIPYDQAVYSLLEYSASKV